MNGGLVNQVAYFDVSSHLWGDGNQVFLRFVRVCILNFVEDDTSTCERVHILSRYVCFFLGNRHDELAAQRSGTTQLYVFITVLTI